MRVRDRHVLLVFAAQEEVGSTNFFAAPISRNNPMTDTAIMMIDTFGSSKFCAATSKHQGDNDNSFPIPLYHPIHRGCDIPNALAIIC